MQSEMMQSKVTKKVIMTLLWCCGRVWASPGQPAAAGGAAQGLMEEVRAPAWLSATQEGPDQNREPARSGSANGKFNNHKP